MVKDFSSDFSDDSEHSRAPVPLHVKNINIYYLTFMLYIKLRVRFCQGSRVDRRRRGAASTIGGETISMKVSDFCCFFFLWCFDSFHLVRAFGLQLEGSFAVGGRVENGGFSRMRPVGG